jgi:hypothetical protein
MLGFWINYACAQTIDVNTIAQWTVPLAVQLIPGVLLFTGMIFCPESPRYLARKDDFEGAEKVLCRLRGLPAEHEYIRREIADIRAQVEAHHTSALTLKQQFNMLFQKGVRNRMAIGMALMFLQSFTGTNVITYYAPRIFETLGIVGTSTKLFSTGLYGCFKTLGMLTFTFWVVERVGRRRGLLWGSAIGCIPMFYLGGFVLLSDPAAAAAAGDTSRTPAGWVAMVAIYFNAFVICATWQGITWCYAVSTLCFSSSSRAICMAKIRAELFPHAPLGLSTILGHHGQDCGRVPSSIDRHTTLFSPFD